MVRLLFVAMVVFGCLFAAECLSKDSVKQTLPENIQFEDIGETLHKLGVDAERKADGTWGVRFEDELPIGDDVVRAAMGTKEKPGPLRSLKVSSVDLWNSQVTAKGIGLIAELRDVEELILSGTEVDVDGMKAIAKMPKLKALMPGINVKSEALQQLANHPMIEWLDLQTCIVDDKAIDAIVTIKGLKSLNLSNQKWLTPASLRKLSQIKGLESLSMEGAGIDDEELAALSGMTSLRFLDLDFNEGITGAGFANVTGLDSLEGIQIYQVPFEGRHLQHLARFTKLKKLVLHGKSQRFELVDFAVLAAMKNLEKIVVGECKKDAEAEKKLAGAMPGTSVVYLGE